MVRTTVLTIELGRFNVTEKSETETPSRRKVFSFLGLAAVSLAVMPVLLMTPEDAEAQGTTTTTPQTGTQRRQERRGQRQERRQERRTNLTERRIARRQGRTERRQQRRGTTPSSSGTPQ